MTRKKRSKTKSLVGRTENGRIDFTESTENALLLQLASLGFHGRLIAEHTGLTAGQVYTRCYQLGIKLRDYRNGESVTAIEAIQKQCRIITLPKNSATVKRALAVMQEKRQFHIQTAS